MGTSKKVWKGEATLLATNQYSGGDADLAADFQKLKETLKVEDEMEWQPMKEVFHTD